LYKVHVVLTGPSASNIVVNNPQFHVNIGDETISKELIERLKEQIEQLKRENSNYIQRISELENGSKQDVEKDLQQANIEIERLKEEKKSVQKRAFQVDERERKLEQQKVLWEESFRLNLKLGEDANIARREAAELESKAAEAKKKAIQEDETKMSIYKLGFDGMKLQVEIETAARKEKGEENKTLEADVRRLEDKIRQLDADLAKAMRQDSNFMIGPSVPSDLEKELQQKILEWDEKWKVHDKAEKSWGSVLAGRQKEQNDNPDIADQIDVTTPSNKHAEAIEKRQECEKELQAFKANLQKEIQERERRHNSVDSSNSTSIDSQATAESGTSTAPTEWSCDTCGVVKGWKLTEAAETVKADHRTGQLGVT